jgi:hypothetical protein
MEVDSEPSEQVDPREGLPKKPQVDRDIPFEDSGSALRRPRLSGARVNDHVLYRR